MAGIKKQSYLSKYGTSKIEHLLMTVTEELPRIYSGVSLFGVRVYRTHIDKMTEREDLAQMSSETIKELLLNLANRKKINHRKVRTGTTVGSYEHDVFGPLDSPTHDS
jgi:hypothetical protein